MPALVAKVVNGEKLTQRQFRERVIETVRMAGEEGADTAFILDQWKDRAWFDRENRYLISHTMANMERLGVLKKVKRGYYRANEARIESRGLVASESTERQVIRLLRARDGFAKFDQLLPDFGVTKGSDDPTITRHIYRAMTRSPDILRFHHKNPKARGGLWRLSDAHLATMPLTGELYALLYEDACGLQDVTKDDLETQFAHIGEAFGIALHRTRNTWDHVLQIADAQAFLLPWARRWNQKLVRDRLEAEVRQPYDLIEGETARRLRAEGLSDPQIIEAREAAREALLNQSPLAVLTAFGDGDVEAHRTAPMAFYMTMGQVLDLDSAQLSRGVIQRIGKFEDVSDEDPDFLTFEEE